MGVPAVLFVRRFGRGITTPDLYRLVATGLVLLGLVAGSVAVATTQHRSALLRDIVAVNGPLSVGAQELYRSLSDADATASDAFLANGAEPAVLRQRYLDDIARATSALTVALAEADQEDAARLAVLADQLPVYTGLVETARSYNRLGVPLGAAYLREASGLMRQTLLPAADQVLRSAQGRLIAGQREAAGFPWAVLLLGLVVIGSLLAAQVLIARRSNRVFNRGLLAASLAALISLVWSTTAVGLAARHVETGHRDGSALVSLLADARRAALQARADESLTLVARGSGAAFEKEFGVVLTELIGVDGRGGMLAGASARAPSHADRAVIEEARGQARRWRDLHVEVRKLDDRGDYLGAVKLATAAGPESLSGRFGKLDAAISTALDQTNERVHRQAGHAGNALGGLAVALVLLTAALLTAIVVGIRPRIGEYR